MVVVYNRMHTLVSWQCKYDITVNKSSDQRDSYESVRVILPNYLCSTFNTKLLVLRTDYAERTLP